MVPVNEPLNQLYGTRYGILVMFRNSLERPAFDETHWGIP